MVNREIVNNSRECRAILATWLKFPIKQNVNYHLTSVTFFKFLNKRHWHIHYLSLLYTQQRLSGKALISTIFPAKVHWNIRAGDFSTNPLWNPSRTPSRSFPSNNTYTQSTLEWYVKFIPSMTQRLKRVRDRAWTLGGSIKAALNSGLSRNDDTYAMTRWECTHVHTHLHMHTHIHRATMYTRPGGDLTPVDPLSCSLAFFFSLLEIRASARG